MLSEQLSRQILTRVLDVRRRRVGGIYGWQPPPDDWREIVRRTWPGLVRHRLERVPDGWVDLVLAFADHLEGRSIVIFDAHEDLVTGKLAIVHTWRRGQPEDDDSNKILDHYEDLSGCTCRECGAPGEKVRKGSGRLATTRVLCERHVNGDEDG